MVDPDCPEITTIAQDETTEASLEETTELFELSTQSAEDLQLDEIREFLGNLGIPESDLDDFADFLLQLINSEFVYLFLSVVLCSCGKYG